MPRWKKALLWVAGLFAGAVLLCAGVAGPCWTSWAGDGILVWECPAGDVRPVARAEVDDLGRKDAGSVRVWVDGHWWHPRWGQRTDPIRRFSEDLVLVAPDGKEIRLGPEDRWRGTWGHGETATVRLPDVPDGDYRLRVVADTPAGDATVEVPLPLYVPALGHALTDAPLYKPGQTVRFRAVLLAEDDLAPLEGRPGTWRVTAPDGETLLEEKGATGPFGVAASSFPLDGLAESGTWTVRFDSGQTSASASFDVRPFQLPRFTVTAGATRPAFHAGDVPRVEGTVRYTTGAPVAGASIRVRPRASGTWPPPPAWLEEQTVVADAGGRFAISFPPVPGDLVDTGTLALDLSATDATGDLAVASASLLFSADRIAADAVTELGGGLVASTNNRVYVRVTTPEGRALAGATVRVRRDLGEDEPWLDAVADLDGVARFQVDPGEPVTVVVPPPPARPRPRAETDPVRLLGAYDALEGGAADLLAQSRLGAVDPALDRCARFTTRGESRTIEAAMLRGEVVVGGPRDALADCFADVLRGAALSGGLWSLRWEVRDPGSPAVLPSATMLAGGDPGVAIDVRAARACVAGADENRRLPRALAWSVQPNSTQVRTRWVEDPSLGGTADAATAACVERAVTASLASPSAEPAAGLVRFTVELDPSSVPAPPQATTWPGFAYQVAAVADGVEVGRTVLRMRVGEVPPLRLRASEVIVDPGDEVELTAIRGPGWRGSFPKELALMQGGRRLAKFAFSDQTRTGRVTVPDDAAGFVHVQLHDARAVLYVRPKAKLDLALAADRETYRPGDVARLTVLSRDLGGPVAAGVTLTGVDATLAQLAPLPGVGDFVSATVRAASGEPAFGTMDARALQVGMVRGENAAQATVLRVTGLPEVAPGADRVTASADGAFDPHGELADAFYELYGHARAAVREWEKTSSEPLTAKQMASLWAKTLAAHPAEDAFGRPLALANLPPDLLALTDPRFMVSDGARLPEDVEDWAAFVAEEGS
ncbi:MAG: MG2 domain-containing protein [Myxococcota bacterium]